jgi:hypothetical protein
MHATVLVDGSSGPLFNNVALNGTKSNQQQETLNFHHGKSWLKKTDRFSKAFLLRSIGRISADAVLINIMIDKGYVAIR